MLTDPVGGYFLDPVFGDAFGSGGGFERRALFTRHPRIQETLRIAV